MANVNCEACEALKQEVPELVANGFDDTMCASLQNDTGLKPSVGHNDCTDLENLNDCLIGNMAEELEDYDTCDWKEFMRNFIPNLWTNLKAIGCAICGIWTNIHNLWTFAKSYNLEKNGEYIVLQAQDGEHGRVHDDNTTYTLTQNGDTLTLNGSDGTSFPVTVVGQDTWKPNTKDQEGYVTAGDGHNNQIWATDANGNPAWRNKDVIDGQAFIRYYRDLGAGDSVPYWDNVSDDFHPSALNIYMDSAGASGGSRAADRDYVVIVSNCTNYVGFQELHGYVTYYSSGDTRPIADIRSHQAQHPVIFGSTANDTFANFSWTTSGAVLLKAGEHIKVDFYVTAVEKGNAQDTDNTRPKVRLHQFVLVWIPVSVDTITPS